ncbi:MAG TPA: manganese transporter, partial [Candidatus Binatia bacterium]|nr:manganese transporter [Candidatus Binatia bacterium]
GGALLWWLHARAARRAEAGEAEGGVEAGPQLAQARATWRTPPEALPRPQLTPLRRAGLLTLRAYILVAVALLVIKIISLA